MKNTIHKLTAVATVALAFAGPARAAPTTVDFENYDTTAIHPTMSSQGYNFAPASGNLASLVDGANCGPACAANGTATLVVGGEANPFATGPLLMTSASTASFYLLGFDFAEFVAGGNAVNATSLQVIGNRFGGGTVSQVFFLDGLNDGPGGIADFQAAAMSSAWASSLLTSVSFAGFADGAANKAFQLDNISVSARRVPEPASLMLLAIAALGFGASRRKRSA